MPCSHLCARETNHLLIQLGKGVFLCLSVVEKTSQHRSRVAQRLNVLDGVRFASSLAAALLDSLFEQPINCCLIEIAIL
jgi:hypothetical protein